MSPALRPPRCLLLASLAAAHFVLAAAGGGTSFLSQRRGRGGLGLDAASALQHDDGGQQSMKHLYPWYHTGSEIGGAARKLAAECGALSVRTVSQDGVSVDVASVKAKDSSPTNKVFILFGEHSRELISPETGLYLLRVLCGSAESDSARSAAEILRDSEFQMVLNGNPRSRKEVEHGSFCTRMNPNGVDLNRNWDEKWKSGGRLESNPGPYPFSEPETRIFRQLVSDYGPTTFLTVHSGTRGLYMPWAYDKEHLATRNQEAMLQILRDVDRKHCQCPFGAAGREVGYSCPGTCLDWAYDKLKTPYSFAFEIYTSPMMDVQLRSRWQDKLASGGASLLEAGNHLGHEHFRDLFGRHGSDFVHTRGGSGAGWSAEGDCFGTFNPDTHEGFNATLRNWAGAYLDMASLVVEDMRKAGNITTGVTVPL